MNGPYECTNVKTVSIVENGINANRPGQERNRNRIVSYEKEGRLQQNEQKNSFCYSPFPFLIGIDLCRKHLHLIPYRGSLSAPVPDPIGYPSLYSDPVRL